VKGRGGWGQGDRQGCSDPPDSVTLGYLGTFLGHSLLTFPPGDPANSQQQGQRPRAHMRSLCAGLFLSTHHVSDLLYHTWNQQCRWGAPCPRSHRQLGPEPRKACESLPHPWSLCINDQAQRDIPGLPSDSLGPEAMTGLGSHIQSFLMHETHQQALISHLLCFSNKLWPSQDPGLQNMNKEQPGHKTGYKA
jgi:hypothetical protein